MTIQFSADVVFDVAPEDQAAYARSSYRDYLRAWNERVEALEAARRRGEIVQAQRLAEELRHVWPQPDDVAEAAWIPDRDREHPLPTGPSH